MVFPDGKTMLIDTGLATYAQVRDVIEDVGAMLLNDRDFGYIHVSSDGSGMEYEISGKP